MLILWLYLATPVFLLLDVILQWDIRVSFLDNHPALKYTYYLICFLFGMIMWKWPAIEPILAVVEGGINILLLTVSVIQPYYAAIDAIASGQTVTYEFGTLNVINYIISGTIVIVSLQIRSPKSL